MYRQQVLNFMEITILVVQDSSAKMAIFIILENFMLYGRIIALLTYNNVIV